MYLSASWVQAPNKNVGTNIRVHPGFSSEASLGKASTVEDAERVAKHPGPEKKEWSRYELRPRMNRVFAYIDIVLDEAHGNVGERIRHALSKHAPALDTWAEHDGVFVQFFQQPYMGGREETYAMLRAQLEEWLNEHYPPRLAAAG